MAVFVSLLGIVRYNLVYLWFFAYNFQIVKNYSIKYSLLKSLSFYLSKNMYYIVIRHLHIRAYTFEDTGVGRVSELRIYLHGLYRLRSVGCDIIG